MDASPIKDVIKDVIKAWSGEARGSSQEEILKMWEGACGRSLAAHSKPVSFRSSRLTVNVDSSAWLYELTLCKRDILKRLQRKFKKKPLKELQFRIGEI
jgi:predicted nucleic acid-binding Zn ribbon protein